MEELNNLKYPKIDYKLEEEKENKPDINIVIIGHVDSGKSTLMGHLLYLQGEVSDKTMQKYEKESKKIGKNTFHFAWAMDEGTEERKRGVTVDIAYKNFQTSRKKVTAMDAPGHKDFIPNMISGTSAADAAILVIDSNKSAFEAGFFLGGQTKEHAVLARSLGVKQVIVCVNKLELMEWSQERFNYIEAQVRDFLNHLDYKDEDLFFIPVSGLMGTNLIERESKIPQLTWYEGPSLIDLVDSLEEPSRDISAPVRFSIADCSQTTINSLQGIGVFGKLQSGVIYEDSEYLILPLGIKTKIRSLTVDNQKNSLIKAGQSGELLLNIDKQVSEEIRSGNIICSLDFPVPVITSFRSQILTLDIKSPLSIGQAVILHCLNQKSPAKIKKIEKIFSRDGKTTKNNTVYYYFNLVLCLKISTLLLLWNLRKNCV
jgi:elongation factor 1 alpha-like protein